MSIRTPDSREDPNSAPLSVESCLEAVRADFPDLKICSADRIAIGLDHVVLDINGQLIFRFRNEPPRTKHREIAVLAKLNELGVTTVPLVTFVGRSREYFGYQKIQGTTLSEHDARHIPAKQRIRLANQIACFLAELHDRFSIDEARRLGLVEYDCGRFDMILPVVRDKFGYDAALVQFAERAVLAFSRLNGDTVAKRVLHWDLHNGNLVLDPDDHSLRGVIDFDTAAIGDVHAEFRSIYRFNPALAKEVMTIYSKLTGQTLCFEKAVLYAWLVRLSDLAERAQGPNGRTHVLAMQRIKGWIADENGPKYAD
jgi:aminoglycoside phosphotransferase (APT) family kinase protein